MSDTIVTQEVAPVSNTQETQAPVVSEREQIEQEAINRYKESLQSPEERANAIPEGFNEDGTPKEELIAGKFKSQDDLLKAYQELEKKLGQPKTEETKPVENTSEQTATNNEGKQVDVSKFHAEFRANGNLSDASYQELEKLGFIKKDVDDYIEGQQLLANTFANSLFEKAGGQDKYIEMVNWASQNVDRNIIEDYNKAVADGNRQKVTQLAEYMNFKYQEALPKEPVRINGNSDSYGGMQPFAHKDEWQQATNSRLYGKDAKYTNMVDKRYLESRKRGLI